MSDSFPFLALAKQFDVDYGDTLLLAEYYGFRPPPWQPGIDAYHRLKAEISRDQWTHFYTKLAMLMHKHRGNT